VATNGRRVQLENLTRDRILIPVESGGTHDDGKALMLGDKLDTDDRVPRGVKRNEALQPKPAWEGTREQYEAFGSFAHGIIADQVAQKRIRRTELAG
jgi:hypothetical protein